MKFLTVALLLCMALAAAAADECTFDQDHQVNVITSIAARFPGGSVNTGERQVTWESPAEGTTLFSYGGCYDLGSMITRSTQLAAPRTEDQIFELARELSVRFWSNEIVSERRAAEALLAGLRASKYTTEESNGKMFYSISDPGYVELCIEHEYRDGIDHVVIAWQGNF